MPALGTLEWLDRRNGRLAWHERQLQLAQVVMARARSALGPAPGKRLSCQDPAAILPPDSAMTRAALALAAQSSPAWLLNHCLRAYCWARLLDTDRRPFDDEVVYVALLLHDLGLTPAWRLPADGQQCFTAVGAAQVTALADRHGWGGKQARLAAQAISLHLNVSVAHRHGKEARLVRSGSGADAAGLGLDRLSAAQVGVVVARHPRLGMERELSRVLQEEACHHPKCRTAFLVWGLGFDERVRQAPAFTVTGLR